MSTKTTTVWKVVSKITGQSLNDCSTFVVVGVREFSVAAETAERAMELVSAHVNDLKRVRVLNQLGVSVLVKGPGVVGWEEIKAKEKGVVTAR